jgi:multidrug resistance efflux pump
MMRRRLPFLRLVVGLSVALVSTAVAGLWLVRIDRVVIAPGRLAGGSIPVTSPMDGRVGEVLALGGASVAAGEPLVRLETETFESEAAQSAARIAGLEERIAARAADRERLKTEVHPREREQASRALERARLELSQAEVEAQAMKRLGDEGLAGRLDVERAELARDLAAMELEEARAAIPLLRSEQTAAIAEIATALVSLRTELDAERESRAETLRRITASSIVAPRAGVVVATDLADLAGRHVDEGEVLLHLAVTTAERFEGTVGDNGRSVAAPGQKVRIRLAGYPWLIHGTLAGTLENVSDRRDADGGFAVEVAFDPSTAPGALYEGMAGTARIVVDERVSLGRLLIERLTRSAGS